MFFVADLHIHSKFSRATSQQMDLENLHKWAQLKGVKLIATGDFTHPGWFHEIQTKLEPAEPGFFKLKDEFISSIQKDVPESCITDVRFILEAEISSIYSKNGRTRKVHNLVYAPSFEMVAQINERLSRIGNLASDGRPILGLDSKELLKIVLDVSQECLLVPAHAWTPHFSVFGSNSGFDSLEECFEDLTPHIHAIETGLSSDPAMNWRLSALDSIALISNSDAHSPAKIGREANILNTEFSFAGLVDAIKSKDPQKFLSTIEFFPEEGKYHYDGHRNCSVRFAPEETKEQHGICPNCGRPVTIGVMNRVDKLADRNPWPAGQSPKNAIPFRNLIPLPEIIAAAIGVGDSSQAVQKEYFNLLENIGNELRILNKSPREEIEKHANPLIAEGILRVRDGQVQIKAGFDGEYGTIQIFDENEKETFSAQATLF